LKIQKKEIRIGERNTIITNFSLGGKGSTMFKKLGGVRNLNVKKGKEAWGPKNSGLNNVLHLGKSWTRSGKRMGGSH